MKQKTIFCCSECGNETVKWSGKCPSCGSWDSLVEVKLDSIKSRDSKNSSGYRHAFSKEPKLIAELDTEEELRFSTGIGELDRVLGGGAVKGSLVLVGGAPGIGKSTLLLQLCGLAEGNQKILYVTGEESERQLKMRAQRLGVDKGEVYVLAETGLNEVLETADSLSPDIVIIDSIQTMFDPQISSAPGSISQVRECTMSIMRKTKEKGFTTFVIGHINKDGNIAGPKVLEHMVDCVLYFEGERSTSFRILRAGKNRFGSTNEIGVFDMVETGLREIENPSEVLLSGRPENAPGTCVTCVIEGSRPILAEIQALVAPSAYNSGRRNTNGIDYNRATLLLAVLEKRGGMAISGCDAYVNVIGGLELDEPAADLATLLAIASSFRDLPLGRDLAAVGEVGLSGEIRSVSNLNARLSEIARLGFKRCVVPAHIKDDIIKPNGLTIISVKDIRDAIMATLG